MACTPHSKKCGVHVPHVPHGSYASDRSCYDFSLFRYNTADWNSIKCRLLDVDWYMVFNDCNNVNDMWLKFCSILYDLLVMHCKRFTKAPQRPNTRAGNRIIKFPHYIKKLLAKKKCAWKKLRKCRNQNNRSKFSTISNSLKKGIAAYFYKRERTIIKAGNRNGFYNYVKRFIKKNTDIPPLKSANGKFLVDDDEKAAAFNNHFSSVFTTDNGIIPHAVYNYTHGPMTDIQITDSIICNAIKRLKSASSAGHDGLPTEVFKKLTLSLTLPLRFIFNASLDSGQIPDL